MSVPNGPGLIELPGMKGTIQIHYDLTRGDVGIEPGPIALPNLVQILILAVQATVGQWAQIDAGIVGRKGNATDGHEEKTSQENDDDDKDHS